jgi:hypothetical protein
MKATLLREVMSLLVGWWDVDLEQGVVSPVRLDSSTDRSVAWERERGERVASHFSNFFAASFLLLSRASEVSPFADLCLCVRVRTTVSFTASEQV